MCQEFSTLTYLIQPVDVTEFKNTYWEERPMRVHRKTPDYYTGLLTLGDIEQILPTMRAVPDAVRVVKNGCPVELGKTIDETDAILGAYEKGATVILLGLHKYWPPLTRFCNSLAYELSCPFQVNAYLTPPAAVEARGLGIHFDVHDVFVVQLSGSKHWGLYQSPVRLPLENDSFVADGASFGRAQATFDLNPGDCLYIPRGYIHEAVVQESNTASLHLTFGVKCLTWMHLIQAIVQVAGSDDARLRASLPIGFARDDTHMGIGKDRIREMIGILAADNYVTRAVQEIADDLLHQQRSTLDHRLTDIESCASIDLSANVYRKQGVVSQLNCGDEQISLAFQGKEVIMPTMLEPAIRFILRTPSFSVQHLPGDLDDASKLVLVRRLVREGLLTLQKGESTRDAMISPTRGHKRSAVLSSRST